MTLVVLVLTAVTGALKRAKLIQARYSVTLW